jgi:Ribbon-helix-helix protein, copG family
MRRVNVHIDDELDADLTREAKRTGRSPRMTSQVGWAWA